MGSYLPWVVYFFWGGLTLYPKRLLIKIDFYDSINYTSRILVHHQQQVPMVSCVYHDIIDVEL